MGNINVRTVPDFHECAQFLLGWDTGGGGGNLVVRSALWVFIEINEIQSIFSISKLHFRNCLATTFDEILPQSR